MANITKALVLKTFTKNYKARADLADRRRALVAYNITTDDLAPSKEPRSPKESLDADLVSTYLIEILAEDYKIEMRKARKYTAEELAGTKLGGKAAQDFLKGNADRVPALPASEDAAEQWLMKVKAWAFGLAPKDHAADTEWTSGFVTGFTGSIWKYAQQASWKRSK